jgi:hypothetical protein
MGAGDLVLLTETAPESRLRRAVDQLARQPVVDRKPVVLRVLE